MPGRIIPVSKNKFKFVFELGRGSGKRKRQTFIFDGGIRAAEREFARMLLELEKSSHLSPDKITVESYLKTWIETHKISERTRQRYEGIIISRIIPKIGGLQLKKLSPLDIKKMYIEILKDGRLDGKPGDLSNGSLKYIHVVLRCALKWAMIDTLISSNPADAVQAPRIDTDDEFYESKEQAKCFTKSEVADLLGVIKDPQFYTLVFVDTRTGLRRGELLALKWQDIDLKNSTLSVKQSIAYTKAKGTYFKPPKTKKSRRTIEISKEVIEILKLHKKKQDQMKMRYRTTYQDNGLVFCQANGSPMHPDTPTKWFLRLLKKTDLPQLNFHCLRHTHASLLLEAANTNPEITLKMISERLGHSSIGVTMDIYGHLMPGMQRQAVDKLEMLFKN